MNPTLINFFPVIYSFSPSVREDMRGFLKGERKSVWRNPKAQGLSDKTSRQNNFDLGNIAENKRSPHENATE